MIWRTDKYKAISAATPVMAMLHSKAIRPCLERFSSTLISVGSFLAFGSSSILVCLMKSTAFTEVHIVFIHQRRMFANFTGSAVSNITFRSWIDSLSFSSNRRSIISADVISMALNPKRSFIYIRMTSVSSV